MSLTTHKIDSSHHPTVDLFLDGKSIVTIGIEVEVARSIAGVLAVVQHGRLTEIKSGSCAVSGLLAVQQIEITKRQRKFDLPARSGCTLVCRYSSQAQALDLSSRSSSLTRKRRQHEGTGTPTRRGDTNSVGGMGRAGHSASLTQGRTMSDPLVCEPAPNPVTEPVVLRR